VFLHDGGPVGGAVGGRSPTDRELRRRDGPPDL